MISKSKKRKLNPTLMLVLLISGGVHLLALFVLGGIAIYNYIVPDEAQFEEPPPIQAEEPPPEMKIEIKPKAAPQDQPLDNLRMKQVSNIAVANVDIDLPSMGDSFTVSSGLGGFGGGSLMGGTRGSIGFGMSNVSVFGLESKAERVLFAVDASRTMMTDEKGGLNSYKVIKDEIVTMVGNLSTGTLFNVVFFDGKRYDFFKEKPVAAGVEITEELRQWVAPINADYNKLGLRNVGRQPLLTGMEGHPVQEQLNRYVNRFGTSSQPYRLQLFMEQAVDAIFMIVPDHDGFGRLQRDPTEEELAKAEEINSKEESDEIKAMREAYNKAKAEAVKKAEAMLAAENKRRAAKGLPPKVIDGFILGEYNVPIDAPKPPMTNYIPKKRFFSDEEIEKYFDDLVEKLYGARGGKPPSVNVIVFLADDEEFSEKKEEAVENYTRQFGGKYRLLRGLKQISEAASAERSVN